MIFDIAILISNEIENFFPFFPKWIFKTNYYFVKYSKAYAFDSSLVGTRQLRSKANQIFFQNTQRNTDYNFFAVKVNTIFSGNFDHITRIVDLIYAFIEVYFSVFTTFIVNCFKEEIKNHRQGFYLRNFLNCWRCIYAKIFCLSLLHSPMPPFRAWNAIFLVFTLTSVIVFINQINKDKRYYF